MANLQKTILIGRVGRDAETRYTPSGAMNVSFSVAVNPPKYGDKEPETEWYRVTAWGKLAERLDKATQDGWFGKGAQVYVEGRLSVRLYAKKDGSGQGLSLDLNASEVQTLQGVDRPAQQGQVTPATDFSDVPF